MLTYIESDTLRVGIRHLGAELASMTTKDGNREYIWQADPAIWDGSAPILFPITGVLREGHVLIDGKACEIPKHGFCRSRSFELVAQSPSACTFRTTHDEDTLTYFPFEFTLEVEFSLSNSDLQVTYTVVNTGSRELLFSIGSHPALMLPTEEVSAYELAVDTAEPLTISRVTNTGLVEPDAIPLARNENEAIQLTPSLFNDDALVFINSPIRAVTLRDRDGNEHWRMRWEHTPHLGIWAKPNAPYVCIEPWQSYADSSTSSIDFAEKAGIRPLAAGATSTDGYTIEVLGGE
ncbi:MAG: aldose 1-epimerase family protein [Pseudomonadales bacterium]|jgi:galactose mutarotase-like enzyme